MATYLNMGTFAIDFRFKPRGREGVMVAGAIKMGAHDCLVRPQDIELRTIRSMVLTPMSGTAWPPGAGSGLGSYVGQRTIILETYMGSLGNLDKSRAGSMGSGNYMRIRACQVGSFAPTVGTCRVGSALPGSVRVSFLAFGN